MFPWESISWFCTPGEMRSSPRNPLRQFRLPEPRRSVPNDDLKTMRKRLVKIFL